MQIEGDGETDQYDIRVSENNFGFLIRGLSRTEMKAQLLSLRTQFEYLTDCFDEMKANIKNSK